VPELVGQLFGLAVVASAIRSFVPLYLAAVGGVFSERAGVVNVGIDGTMIFGAWFGAWGALRYGAPAGLALAVVAGMAVAAVHALATVTLRVDQLVSGVAINVLALGVPRYLSVVAYGQGAGSPAVPRLPALTVPRLGEMSPIVPLTVVLGVAAWLALNRTVPGLRLRSAGEDPLGAERLGVRVAAARYAGVVTSGAFAGLAGAYLSVELVGRYGEGMNQGRGFVALAALLLANRSVAGAVLSCLLFGWTEALTAHLRVGRIDNAFVQALPYVVTLVVLGLFLRRVRPPRAVGQAYEAGAPI
jgi:general nucleoside transport system permease protein